MKMYYVHNGVAIDNGYHIFIVQLDGLYDDDRIAEMWVKALEDLRFWTKVNLTIGREPL